jgi:hypothetical protein
MLFRNQVYAHFDSSVLHHLLSYTVALETYFYTIDLYDLNGKIKEVREREREE